MKRKFPEGVDIYYGSNWWCLTRDAALSVLAYFDRHPAFLKWCRCTASPDELFIQTAQASPALFARKFDIIRSRALLDALDTQT